MKILHVETGKHLYGGARQVVYIAEGLQQRGVENHLVSENNSAISKEINLPQEQIHCTTSAGDLDLRFLWQLITIIRRIKPDLIHLHSRRGADVLGGIAAKLLNVPAVLSRRVDNPENKTIAGLKYRLYAHIITISEGIKDVLVSEGVAPKKITCVRSAIDPTEFQSPTAREDFLSEFSLSPEHTVIGVIAQLIPRKGHRYLLDVLPDICKAHPNVRVLIFGQGPLAQEIQDSIEQKHLHHYVQLTGFRNDLPRWLGNLDLVVHPAEMEGLGVSLIQTAAAGVPIIASRAGGMPEIVLHDVNGFLIEPGDSHALKRFIVQLVEDTQLREKMGNAGRQYVEETYSIDTMVAGNLAIYRKALGVN